MIDNNHDGAEPVSRWRWWIHLLLIGGYLPITALLATHFNHGPALGHTGRSSLLALSKNFALFAIIFAAGWLSSRASREQLLLRWRPGWWVIPLGLGYSIGIRIGLAVVVTSIVAILVMTGLLSTNHVNSFVDSNLPQIRRLVDPGALRHDPTYLWLNLTLGSFVLAGLREEMWRSGTLAAMRVLWPNAFDQRDGQIIAVVLLSFIFGLGHLYLGLIAAAAATIMGFALGMIMVLHRSVWPAVVTHGFIDATSFALLSLIHLPPTH